MRLDKSKKYAFAGDTYAWTQEQQRWSACYLTFVWKEGEFQHLSMTIDTMICSQEVAQ